MREIIEAKPIPNMNGWLLCDFDNGERRFIDIRPSMIGILEKLEDPQVFNQVFVDKDAGTVAWPDDIHIDPDTLYKRGIEMGELKNLAKVINSDEHGDWLERA